MSDSKVYMLPDLGNSGLASMLGPLLSQKGIDPNMLLAMQNNGGFGNLGGWFMWIIFLFFLMGWNGNGFGFNRNGFDNGLLYTDNLINNSTGRDLLMSAIQGNGTAINQLASTLNCNIGDIQAAINGVMSQIQSVGNQVGMSSQQVINSVLAGNCQIANQISQCCCNVKDAITRLGYENQLATINQTNTLQSNLNTINSGIERGFSQAAYETASLTCSINNTIKDASNASTTAIISKLDAMQNQGLLDKIDALRERNSTLVSQISQEHQTAQFGQMIGLAITPINAAIAGLTKEVSDIQCKLPNTVTLPYSCATAVPTSSVYNGLVGYGFGWNNGYWG